MQIPLLDQELKQKLPSPQGVALAIMEACRDEDVSIGDVSNLVQMDPALSGRLLEQANSAANGGRPVVSAVQAVNRLGLQSVRQLALGFSLVDQYSSGKCLAFDYGRFWSHSLLMGLALREIGSHLKLGSSDELFSAGLLARVGCLALATAYPAEYGKIIATGANGSKLTALEKKFLHVEHLGLSGALLSQWGIPKVFVAAAAYQEDPSELQVPVASRPWQLNRAMHLALKIAEFAMSPAPEQPAGVARLSGLATELGIDALDLSISVDAVVLHWQEWGNRLKVKTLPVASFESIAAENVRPDKKVNASLLRVLIVEDDPIARQIVEVWLAQKCGYSVQLAHNGEEALKSAMAFDPHVVLTDWRMPVMDGIELCCALRASEWGQNIYIIMLTSADQENELVQAFNAGVDDYLSKPINLVALSARLKAACRYVRLRDAWEQDNSRLSRLASELALSNRRLQHSALTDPLTELSNRRAGLNALNQAWSAAVRHGQSLTVISIDIDHFKRINDTQGHAAGDAVLQSIARTLRAAARNEDTVCRWGGEEFLIISPNVNGQDGMKTAERLRKVIAENPVKFEGKLLPITASFGIAPFEPSLKSVEQLLSRADEALYAAKDGGRNCVKPPNIPSASV
jgi:two-component system, cell cycle response regulator